VTPYLSEEQIVSGTLAFALGTGRVIISTPYWYAQELLADGHGRLVPFDDPASLAQTILALKEDPEEYLRIRSRAYAKGRNMTWAVVGEAYWRLLSEVAANGALRSDEAVSGALAV
jgi:glycosyltransferase involved in cell wall biosynthesis